MSLADRTLGHYRRAMARVGETVTVRRYSGTGAGRAVALAADAKARIVDYEPQALVGSIKQGDRKVILLNDPAAAVGSGKVALAAMLPLRTEDKLLIGSLEVAIEGIDDHSRRVAGTLIALELQVRGN